jgi:hypothetical protein
MQACAESKVKCSLQQPCSKCASRGRECIFINDPEASRNRKLGRMSAHSALSVSPSESDLPESPTNVDSLGPSSLSCTFSAGSHGGDDTSYLASPSQLNGQMLSESSFNLPGLSRASENSSPECSLPSSPRLDFFESDHHHSNPFSLSLDTLELDSELGNLTASLGPFVESPFAPCLPRPPPEADLTTRWFETNQSFSGYGNGEPTRHSQPHTHSINQDFVSAWTNLGTSSGKTPFSRQHFSKGYPVIQNGATQTPSVTGDPTSEELSNYSMLTPSYLASLYQI